MKFIKLLVLAAFALTVSQSVFAGEGYKECKDNNCEAGCIRTIQGVVNPQTNKCESDACPGGSTFVNGSCVLNAAPACPKDTALNKTSGKCESPASCGFYAHPMLRPVNGRCVLGR